VPEVARSVLKFCVYVVAVEVMLTCAVALRAANKKQSNMLSSPEFVLMYVWVGFIERGKDAEKKQ